jgi:hypothetical protein
MQWYMKSDREIEREKGVVYGGGGGGWGEEKGREGTLIVESRGPFAGLRREHCGWKRENGVVGSRKG